MRVQAQRPVEGPEGTRLASQAFEAINEAVRSAAADTLPLVAQLIPLTLQKLTGTLAMAAAAPDARERQSEMQARAVSFMSRVLRVLWLSDVMSMPRWPWRPPRARTRGRRETLDSNRVCVRGEDFIMLTAAVAAPVHESGVRV